MENLEGIVSNINVFKVFGLVLQRFYKNTGIVASFNVSFNKENEVIEVLFSFDREPTQENYAVLFDELIDAEKIILNEYVLSIASGYENINQLVFKHKEDLNIIFNKQKKEKM